METNSRQDHEYEYRGLCVNGFLMILVSLYDITPNRVAHK